MNYISIESKITKNLIPWNILLGESYFQFSTRTSLSESDNAHFPDVEIAEGAWSHDFQNPERRQDSLPKRIVTSCPI